MSNKQQTSKCYKIIVCGGRDYNDIEHVFEILDFYNPYIVVHGNATGADTLASYWAYKKKATESISSQLG